MTRRPDQIFGFRHTGIIPQWLSAIALGYEPYDVRLCLSGPSPIACADPGQRVAVAAISTWRRESFGCVLRSLSGQPANSCSVTRSPRLGGVSSGFRRDHPGVA
jgi:hypothetical protein